MAYSVKYLFKFESSNGTTREIRVLQDGYTGEVIQRPLGRAPVLKKQQNGPVHGTSLEFFAECNVDREFIEFYTSDPKAYRVDLYAGATLLWQGYITPELYSEPDIAPPYDVQVVATDGVGELKLYEYAAQGTVTLRTLLSGLLSRTGLGTDIYLISSLKPGSAGAGSLLEKTINLDYMAGEICYDVLTYLLDTLHATITWWKGAWILTRETNVTFTNGKVRYFNTAGNSALLNDSVQVLGKMYVNPAWPVGQLSTVIDPAKNKIEVQAPWHPVTCLQNPDMTSDASWTKINSASYDSTNGGYLLPFPQGGTGQIRQQISMAGLRVPMSISVRAAASTSTISGQVVAPQLGVLLIYTVGNASYHLRKGSDGAPVWESGALPSGAIPAGTQVDFQQTLSIWDASWIEAEELKVENIPAFMQGGAFPAGTMTVYIIGYCATVFSAHLDVVLPKGYADILHIGNGARGEGNTVEIAIGRETADNAYYAAFLQGLLLDSGSLITSFSDANFTTGMDYLAFIARDYALSVALPRAKVTGTVFLEGSVQIPPLVFTKGALNYWLQTWSWNLKEDELEISARTLPSSSLTVQSETILESNGSTVSSAGGAGSPGSSMGGGGGTNYWEIDGTLNTLVKPKDAYAYVHSKDGLFFTGAALSGTVVPDLYVDIVNDQRVLRSSLPLITGGDQIVIDGTPGGGGGGGGATTLAGLDDVQFTSLTQGQYLTYNGSKWINIAAPSFTLTPATASVLGGIKVGSGLSITSDGTLSTTNSGTVTQVKVGSTAYNPTDGVVSLPAYPTTLPASDVSAWAKASTKPSYAFSEITGTATISQVSGLQTALDGKQPLDADLTAIAAISTGTGLLKRSVSGSTVSWSIDTNTYLTGITSTMVTTALGYTPANVTALADYVKLNPGAVEQTIQSSISSINKGVINLWRKGNNWSFIGFSNGDTETFLGSLGFLSSSDKSAYRRTDDSHYYKIWDAGNDGASSGLDADLLDGQHGSYYAPLSALDNYLPLTAGTSKPLTDSLYIITGDTDKCIQFSYSTNHLAGAAWRILSSGSGSSDTNYLSFQTGGSTATATTWNNVLRLSMDNRYVGINMDAPAYQLDVNGTARVTSLKIGSATITWNSNGYLHIDQPLVTAGDQIVISGTPGGGGGGGATTLAGLDDVAITSVANGQLLQYNGSKWVNVAASTVGRIYSPGTGISISASNVISLNGSEYYSATTSRTANTVLAAPNGSNGAAGFRALVAADIPTLTKSKISDFPTNVSAFTNDAGYITSYIDTKNTAGSTNTSSKIFLIGATSQAANPQTYSHDTVYVGTDGHLYSDSKQVVNISGSQALTNKTYNGYTLAAACAKGVTDNSSNADVTSTDTNLITGRTLYYQLAKKGYTTNTGTVTSIVAGTGLSGGTITTSGTISLTASGVTAGTYYKTTVDTYGRITSGSYANLSAAINGDLTEGSSNPVDADFYIAQYAGGGTSTTSYHRRPHSALYGYIKDKLDSVYVPLTRTVNSKALSANITLTLDDIGNGSTRSLANYLPLSGGTMTGAIQVGEYTAFGVSGSTFYLGSPAYPVNLRSNGTTQINGNTIWHSGNDGSGSGLDADTLDGLHAEGFVRWYSSTTTDFTSYFPTAQIVTKYGSTDGLSGDGAVMTIPTWRGNNANNYYNVQFVFDLDPRTFTIRAIHSGSVSYTNTVYTTANANLSTVDWACKSLTASGNIQANAGVTIANNQSYGGLDTGGTRHTLLSIDYSNTVFLAWGAAGAGYDTNISGNNILFRYGTSHTAGMYLNSSGNVGIGTTTPSYKLHVSGTTGFASGHIYLTGANASSSSGNTTQIVFGTSADNHICLTSNRGAFILNPTTASTAGQVVIRVGSGTTSTFPGIIQSSGDQVVSSDATLKTNLKDVTYSVSDIAKARAVEFDWKDGRGHSMGSIAQDWLSIAPALVHGEEGNMSLAYGQLALVNTIIEAREIETLKARVAELEAEVKRLRS